LIVLAGLASAPAWGADAPAPAAKTAEPRAPVSHPSPTPFDPIKKLDARYLSLTPLLLSVIRHNEVTKLVTLMVTLELVQPDIKPKVEQMMPVLRDAYITDLQKVLSLGIYDHRTVDLVVIKKRLLTVSQKVLGEGMINDVLILNAFERPA